MERRLDGRPALSSSLLSLRSSTDLVGDGASSVSDTYTSTGGTDAVFTALSLTMDAALSLLSCMISAAVGAFAFALTHETFSLSPPSSANASSSKSIAWDVSSSRSRRRSPSRATAAWR